MVTSKEHLKAAPVRRSLATRSAVVADQAAAVAAAWSPPGAPSSWRLTSAQFQALRDACAILPEILSDVPKHALVCLFDSQFHVSSPARELRRLDALIDELGSQLDLDWISVDPLVTMGAWPRDTITGVPIRATVSQRCQRRGALRVISRVSYRSGQRSAALLGAAHPCATWLEWFAC